MRNIRISISQVMLISHFPGRRNILDSACPLNRERFEACLWKGHRRKLASPIRREKKDGILYRMRSFWVTWKVVRYGSEHTLSMSSSSGRGERRISQNNMMKSLPTQAYMRLLENKWQNWQIKILSCNSSKEYRQVEHGAGTLHRDRREHILWKLSIMNR